MVAAAATAAALIVWAAANGPGVSDDSVAYAYAARSFARTGTFASYAGGPMTLYPPGLPFLLGAINAAGVAIPTAAAAVNAASAAGVVIGVYLLARNLELGPYSSATAASLVAVSPATTAVYTMLWSEPLFTVLAVAALCVSLKAVRQRHVTVLSVVSAAVAADAATCVRIIGVTLIPVVAVSFGLATAKPLRPAVRTAALTGILSTSGLAVVAARNLLLHSGPLGNRYAAHRPFWPAVTDTLNQIGVYFLPTGLPRWAAPTVGLSAVAVVAAGAVTAARRRHAQPILLCAWILAWWAALIYSEQTTIIDAINIRLIAPIMPAFAALAVYSIAQTAKPASLAVARSAAAACAATLAAVFASSAGVAAASAHGPAWAAPPESTSQLAAVVARLPAGTEIDSNEPQQLVWESGRGPIGQIPAFDYYSPPAKRSTDLAKLEAELRRSRNVVYLAYWYRSRPAMPPETVAGSCKETGVADGALYACSGPAVGKTGAGRPHRRT